MLDRFHCEDLAKSTVALSDSEAHHAIHVLRLKTNDTIELFDGAGTTATGIITAISRSTVTASVQSKHFVERRTSGQLSVAASPPKGDRLKWMIEKLTEIGVDRYIPLQTTRTVVDPRKTKLDKLGATVISAAKQSEQAWLMDIAPATSLSDLLAAQLSNCQFHLAHPYETGSDTTAAADEQLTDHVLLIGPEGGFTDDEVSLARQSGATPICLAGTILRIETAAIAFSAILKQKMAGQQ